jgi:hypothetical protein
MPKPSASAVNHNYPPALFVSVENAGVASTISFVFSVSSVSVDSRGVTEIIIGRGFGVEVAVQEGMEEGFGWNSGGGRANSPERENTIIDHGSTECLSSQ